MPTMNAVTGTLDALHVARLDPVLGAQPQYRADVRMDHVRGRKRLERRIAALPMFAEPVSDPRKIAMGVRILHVRSEESPAPFEDLCRARNARARQQRRRDPALCRPSRMQKLGLGSIHPAFQQSRGEAAGDARRARQCRGIEPEQLAREISHAEGREESRGMKAALVQFARTKRCRRGRRSRCRPRSR